MKTINIYKKLKLVKCLAIQLCQNQALGRCKDLIQVF